MIAVHLASRRELEAAIGALLDVGCVEFIVRQGQGPRGRFALTVPTPELAGIADAAIRALSGRFTWGEEGFDSGSDLVEAVEAHVVDDLDNNLLGRAHRTGDKRELMAFAISVRLV